MTTQITVYVKDGCELCDQFISELVQVQPTLTATVTIVDILNKPELMAEYGDKIPVAVKDGRIVSQYYFDETAFI